MMSSNTVTTFRTNVALMYVYSSPAMRLKQTLSANFDLSERVFEQLYDIAVAFASTNLASDEPRSVLAGGLKFNLVEITLDRSSQHGIIEVENDSALSDRRIAEVAQGVFDEALQLTEAELSRSLL